eukprot:1195818-Prorocentrum_minimum.AAC.4
MGKRFQRGDLQHAVGWCASTHCTSVPQPYVSGSAQPEKLLSYPDAWVNDLEASSRVSSPINGTLHLLQNSVFVWGALGLVAVSGI